MTGPLPGATGEVVEVTGTESIGPYTLLRVASGGIEPGRPGQFFMLLPPGHVLPRPMSLCRAGAGELCFLIDAIGPGTRALCDLEVGREPARARARSGTASTSRSPGLSSSAGGIGVAPFPYVAQVLGPVPAILGFRSAHHAEAATLLPGAEVVLDPVLVTSLLPEEPPDVLACGPEPMLEAVRRSCSAAHSSRGRRRWRVATGPATAASSRSTVGSSASAWPDRCSARRERPAPQRKRLPRRADGSGRRSATRRLRDEDDHTRARARATRPSRIAETEAGMLNSIGLQGPGIDGVPPGHAAATRRAAASHLGVGRWVLCV